MWLSKANSIRDLKPSPRHVVRINRGSGSLARRAWAPCFFLFTDIEGNDETLYISASLTDNPIGRTCPCGLALARPSDQTSPHHIFVQHIQVYSAHVPQGKASPQAEDQALPSAPSARVEILDASLYSGLHLVRGERLWPGLRALPVYHAELDWLRGLWKVSDDVGNISQSSQVPRLVSPGSGDRSPSRVLGQRDCALDELLGDAWNLKSLLTCHWPFEKR